jgi:exportin-7
LIGLRIFTQLVEEMNNPKSGGLQINLHRRVANSFRDNCLLQIFTVSLATLQRLLSKSVGINDGTSAQRPYS